MNFTNTAPLHVHVSPHKVEHKPAHLSPMCGWEKEDTPPKTVLTATKRRVVPIHAELMDTSLPPLNVHVSPHKVDHRPAHLSPMCGWEKEEPITSSPQKRVITPTKRKVVVW